MRAGLMRWKRAARSSDSEKSSRQVVGRVGT
jgi:hypothetical protein